MDWKPLIPNRSIVSARQFNQLGRQTASISKSAVIGSGAIASSAGISARPPVIASRGGYVVPAVVVDVDVNYPHSHLYQVKLLDGTETVVGTTGDTSDWLSVLMDYCSQIRYAPLSVDSYCVAVKGVVDGQEQWLGILRPEAPLAIACYCS